MNEDVKETIAILKGIPSEAELNKILREEILTVTFLKLDGDQRIMTCTKSWNYIPEANRPTTNKESKAGTVNVWDLNANAWRSFKYDRIQKIEPSLLQVDGKG
jgi:hypothetical protein